MKKRIRPAEEELYPCIYQILVALLWYTLLIKNLLTSSEQEPAIYLFLLLGVVIIYQTVNQVNAVYICRKKRKEAISLGRARKGYINRIRMERVLKTGTRGRKHYERYYYLYITQNQSYVGNGFEIKSSAYRVPLHCYLTSAEVTVYTDESGWHHYIEDLQCDRRYRKNRLFNLENSFEDDGDYRYHQFSKVIVLILIIYVLLDLKI